MDKTQVEKGIKNAGGYAAVGRRLGLTRGAIWAWVEGGKVPAERVIPLEMVIGVPRHLIRPDLYPAPTGAAA